MASANSVKVIKQLMQPLVQEDKKDDCYQMEEVIGGVEKEEHCGNELKWPSGLKINQERLFRYGLFDQNRNNNSQDQGLAKISKTSAKEIKQIKHKVTPCTQKPTSQNNKQNADSHLFSKLSTKTAKQQSFLNKSTSVRILKEKTTMNNFTTVQSIVAESPCLDSIQCKSSHRESKFKIRSSRSKSHLNRTLKTEVSHQKFKLGDTGCLNNESRTERLDISSTLGQIMIRQKSLLSEKNGLELKVQKLREQILKERGLLEQVNRKNKQLSASLVRQDKSSQYNFNEAKLSKKKTQNILFESNHLENTVNQVSLKNMQVLGSISEEKELIAMYQNVIEELRGQLKEEKQDKIDLQKKVHLIKKSISSLAAKYEAQKESNREALGKIYISLEKWN